MRNSIDFVYTDSQHCLCGRVTWFWKQASHSVKKRKSVFPNRKTEDLFRLGWPLNLWLLRPNRVQNPSAGFSIQNNSWKSHTPSEVDTGVKQTCNPQTLSKETSSAHEFILDECERLAVFRASQLNHRKTTLLMFAGRRSCFLADRTHRNGCVRVV